MYIAKFRLYNYKCFRDSGEIELTPGMNIIVGQNNSGKTALLEALSLYITDKPHKSIKVSPSRKTQIEPASVAEYELSIEKKELKNLLLEMAKNQLSLPHPFIDRDGFDFEYFQLKDENNNEYNNHELPELSETDKYIIEIIRQCLKEFQQWLELLPSIATLNFTSKSNKFDCSIDNKIFGLYYPNPPNKEGLYFFIKTKIIDKDGSLYLDIDYPDYYYSIYELRLDKDIIYQAKREEFLDFKILESFRKEIYRFQAERLNVHEYTYTKIFYPQTTMVIEPDPIL